MIEEHPSLLRADLRDIMALVYRGVNGRCSAPFANWVSYEGS